MGAIWFGLMWLSLFWAVLNALRLWLFYRDRRQRILRSLGNLGSPKRWFWRGR